MSPLDWASLGVVACRDGTSAMMDAAGIHGICKAHLRAGDHIYAPLLHWCISLDAIMSCLGKVCCAQGLEAWLDVQSPRHSCPHPALLQRLRTRHPQLLRGGTLQATGSRARPNRSVAWFRESIQVLAHVLDDLMLLPWQSDAIRCSLAAFAQGREVHRCQYGISLLGQAKQGVARSTSES